MHIWDELGKEGACFKTHTVTQGRCTLGVAWESGKVFSFVKMQAVSISTKTPNFVGWLKKLLRSTSVQTLFWKNCKFTLQHRYAKRCLEDLVFIQTSAPFGNLCSSKHQPVKRGDLRGSLKETRVLLIPLPSSSSSSAFLGDLPIRIKTGVLSHSIFLSPKIPCCLKSGCFCPSSQKLQDVRTDSGALKKEKKKHRDFAGR